MTVTAQERQKEKKNKTRVLRICQDRLGVICEVEIGSSIAHLKLHSGAK